MLAQPSRIAGLLLAAIAVAWPLVGDQITSRIAPDRNGCADSGRMFSRGDVSQARAAIVCLVNNERTDLGLAPLVVDASLDRAAQRHAEDMGRRNFYAHRNPDGLGPDDRIRIAGFSGRTTGENIHWGVGLNATPSQIVDDWMNSPGHRENILRSAFSRIGTGIADDPPEGVHQDAGVYVNNFGG